MEAKIQRTQRVTWRPTSSERKDALGGSNEVSAAMLLDALIG